MSSISTSISTMTSIFKKMLKKNRKGKQSVIQPQWVQNLLGMFHPCCHYRNSSFELIRQHHSCGMATCATASTAAWSTKTERVETKMRKQMILKFSLCVFSIQISISMSRLRAGSTRHDFTAVKNHEKPCKVPKNRTSKTAGENTLRNKKL